MIPEIMANNLLAKHILKIIQVYVERYNTLIDEEFGLSADELKPLWEQVVQEQVEEATPPPPPPPPPPVAPSRKSPPSTPPSSRTPTTPPGAPMKKKESQEVCVGCPYIFTKGAKEGQRCGKRSKGSNTYCSRHKKYEGQTPKTKKVLPPLRRSIVSVKRKNVLKKKRQDNVLHKGPGGRLYHRPTGLVFGTDKVAIGTWLRAGDNPTGIDEIIPLTDQDVEIAKKHMFAFRREKPDPTTEEGDTVTKMLKPAEAKKLQRSLSHAIAETNAKAEDVAEILCELQTRGPTSQLDKEEVDNESEYESELEEEEDE